jgi:hypothetical protein
MYFLSSLSLSVRKRCTRFFFFFLNVIQAHPA